MCDVQSEQVDIDLEQELERLYREQGARLWRSIVLSTGSRDVADDAVAEAFAQAIACGGAIHDPAAWISRAAYRFAAGELKERSMAGLTTIHASEDAPAPVRTGPAIAARGYPYITGLVWSPSGRWLAILRWRSSFREHIDVIDAETGQPFVTTSRDDSPILVAWSP